MRNGAVEDRGQDERAGDEAERHGRAGRRRATPHHQGGAKADCEQARRPDTLGAATGEGGHRPQSSRDHQRRRRMQQDETGSGRQTPGFERRERETRGVPNGDGQRGGDE